jgi:hypothetical protein
MAATGFAYKLPHGAWNTNFSPTINRLTNTPTVFVEVNYCKKKLPLCLAFISLWESTWKVSILCCWSLIWRAKSSRSATRTGGRSLVWHHIHSFVIAIPVENIPAQSKRIWRIDRVSIIQSTLRNSWLMDNPTPIKKRQKITKSEWGLIVLECPSGGYHWAEHMIMRQR